MKTNYLVEFFGTMFFFFIIFSTFNYIIIGLSLIFLLYFFNNANLNPAVSIMLVYAGKLNMSDLLPYIIAQLTGGLIGYELAKKYGSLVINNIVSFDKNVYQKL